MIHPKYQKAAAFTLSNIRFEKIASESDSKAGLYLSTDENGVVTNASHWGAKEALRAILERLCELAVGRPAREVAEHGVFYVEHAMRDDAISAPVSGLLCVENSDPAFAIASKMVRDAFPVTNPEKNFWSPPPQKSWSSLSPEEQLSRIQLCISEVITDPKIEALTVLPPTRVVVAIHNSKLSGSMIGHALMKVESELKKRLEPQLEIILESIEDRNQRLGRTHISRSTNTTNAEITA